MPRAILISSEGRAGRAAGLESLRAGARALDVVETAIRPVEVAPDIHSVGLGGWPNLAGDVELDAGLMDGGTLRAGAVGALRGFRHPISVARQVMERLPHVLLVGDGAGRFAAEIGAERGPVGTEEAARREWEQWLRDRVPDGVRERWEDAALVEWSRLTADPETRPGEPDGEKFGTVVVLVRDAGGGLASGSSTCGWAHKYPGRLGDTPVAGAGFHADDRHGAAGCTGRGELTIRAATARSVVLYMKLGATVEEACREALADLRSLARRFKGGVTVHAIDAEGRAHVAAVGRDTDTVRWSFWSEGMATFDERTTAVEPW